MGINSRLQTLISRLEGNTSSFTRATADVIEQNRVNARETESGLEALRQAQANRVASPDAAFETLSKFITTSPGAAFGAGILANDVDFANFVNKRIDDARENLAFQFDERAADQSDSRLELSAQNNIFNAENLPVSTEIDLVSKAIAENRADSRANRRDDRADARAAARRDAEKQDLLFKSKLEQIENSFLSPEEKVKEALVVKGFKRNTGDVLADMARLEGKVQDILGEGVDVGRGKSISGWIQARKLKGLKPDIQNQINSVGGLINEMAASFESNVSPSTIQSQIDIAKPSVKRLIDVARLPQFAEDKDIQNSINSLLKQMITLQETMAIFEEAGSQDDRFEALRKLINEGP